MRTIEVQERDGRRAWNRLWNGGPCTWVLWLVVSSCTGTVDGLAPTGPGSATDLGAQANGPTTPSVEAGNGMGRPPLADCGDAAAAIGRAPLRRLTRFEYNATVRDLLGDSTEPASALPSEDLGNGFGNAADAQSVSSLLAERYSVVAETVARRATEGQQLQRLHTCAANAAAADEAVEEACSRSLIGEVVARAYRRPLEAAELDELTAFARTMRADTSFADGIAAVLEVVLQSPDFLYRIERGVPDPGNSGRRRPSGHEMATRLSYLFWGTLPDAQLQDAARSGALQDAAGVRREATRLLDDPRSRPIVRFFFDNLLPISGLASLERDRTQFPTFSAQIGELMQRETQTFLEREIFDENGSWRSALTAPYTYVNQTLAAFYGIPGVQGEEFRKVALDADKRLGLLTQAGMLAGMTHSNMTSPVLRGSFVLRKLMCIDIPLPTVELLGEQAFAMIKPPEPYTGKTARERFSKHSSQAVCATCHQRMDPVGFALENFDAVGLWRDQENDVAIDPSGEVPGVGNVKSAVELARLIADSEDTQQCFASNWLAFAYGRTLDASDACSRAAVESAFQDSGYNVRELLLSLTQTDAFLYLPAVQP